MDQPHHSLVALVVSLAGLVMELAGGFLLAREDLFKVRDSKRLHEATRKRLDGDFCFSWAVL